MRDLPERASTDGFDLSARETITEVGNILLNALLGVFGNLHPAVVHFPIALISIAALFESVQIVKRRAEPAPGTRAMTALAAVSACFASLFGWFLEECSATAGDSPPAAGGRGTL